MFNQNQIVTFPKRWGICLGAAVLMLSCPRLFSVEISTQENENLSVSQRDLESLDYLVDQILNTENIMVSQESIRLETGSLQKESKVVPDAQLIASCAPRALAEPTACENNCAPQSAPCAPLNVCEAPCCDYSPCSQPSNCSNLVSGNCGSNLGVCCGVFPYIGATGGRGIGWDRDYTTLGVMFASGNSSAKYQPFVDFKWHYNTDRLTAANAGIGLRIRPDCSGVTFGGNVYYDYRDGCYGDLHQIGVGMEAISRCVEVRVNGYFPIQKESSHSKVIFDDYIGNYFVSYQPTQYPLVGADGEAGLVLLSKCNFRAYVGVGGYYFNNRLNMRATGVKGHLSLRYTDKVGFDIYATSDKLFRNRVWGEFYISLPFSCLSRGRNSCNSCCQQPCCACYQRVYRNDWIVLRNGCCWDFNFDDTIGRDESCNNSCGCNGCGCR